MFHVGQEVVCINDKAPGPKLPIIKGQIYTVQWVGTHCSCGHQVVHLGFMTNLGNRCYKCQPPKPQERTRWLLRSDRFAPVISNEELQRLLNQIEDPIVACI